MGTGTGQLVKLKVKNNRIIKRLRNLIAIWNKNGYHSVVNVHRFSCGCEQTFKEKLSKQTKGEYHNCAQIFNPKFKDLRVCVMYLAGIKWFYYCKSKDQENQIA